MDDWTRWALTLGIGSAVILGLQWIGARDDPGRRGGRRLVRMHLGVRIFAVASVPLAGFVVWAASHAAPDQRIVAGLVASVFVLGAVWLVSAGLLSWLAWDEEGIVRHTPLTGTRAAPWSALEDAGYTPLVGSYLKVRGIGRIWLSEQLAGLGPMLDHAARLRPDLFPPEPED